MHQATYDKNNEPVQVNDWVLFQDEAWRVLDIVENAKRLELKITPVVGSSMVIFTPSENVESLTI